MTTTMRALDFKVRRKEAVAVQPTGATPMEVKRLSDLDNDVNFRQLVPLILMYKGKKQQQECEDVAEKIKKALGEALVYYYPWAGRLKEGADGKLVVECTGEGVVFVEAEADASLEELGAESLVHPASPSVEELLYPTNNTLGSPLFTVQLTRLLCGGFVLGLTYHHAMSDAAGASLFLTAVSELAGGASAPSVRPIWQRQELLSARSPPYPPPYTALLETLCGDHRPPEPPQDDDDSTYRSFFFGPKEVAAVRAHLPQNLRHSCTSFDLIVACVLHCRVTSLLHAPEEKLRVILMVNFRDKFADFPIPSSYYGNAVIPAVLVCPANCLYHLGSTVKRVMKAKESVTPEYARSMLDICVTMAQSPSHSFTLPTCLFSDLSRVGFSTLRFPSLGNPEYVYSPTQLFNRHFTTFMVPYTNSKGEQGRLLQIYLPKHALDKFSITLRSLLTSD